MYRNRLGTATITSTNAKKISETQVDMRDFDILPLMFRCHPSAAPGYGLSEAK